MNDQLLFYASSRDAERWSGPFSTIKSLITEAYREHPEDDGAFITGGVIATAEEREMHECKYTVSTNVTFMPWPDWLDGVKRACLSKQRYRSKREALGAVSAALSRRKNRPRSLRAYPCTACNGWHLTKQVDDL